MVLFMATELELRERLRAHLASLLNVKKELAGQEVQALKFEILNVVVRMMEEDVALVEKLMGIRAID